MSQYTGTYKCRLCNALITNPITGNENIAYSAACYAAFDIRNPAEPLYPTIMSVHICEDKSIGITDFLGFIYEG